MIRKKIEYIDVVRNGAEFKEIEKEELKRFLFSVPSLRLYEQMTNRNLFKDYEKAMNRLMGYVGNVLKDNKGANLDNLSSSDQVSLAPILTDSIILNFVLDVVPCLYIEVGENGYIQNEETYNNCYNSVWLMDLVNINFFIEIFQEISAFQSKKK